MSDQPVDLNLEELRELIKLLKESNVSEFELRRSDYRLRIKQGVILEGGLPGSPVATQVQLPSNGQSSDSRLPEPATAEEPVAPKEDLHDVRSPMVGTFYRSASPGAAPFIEMGDRIRKGQVLCIIEAMKIMNEIESDVEGEIREIRVTNGQPVEFGEVLFSIKLTS